MSKRRVSGSGGLFQNKRGYWVASIERPPGPNGERHQKRITRKDRNAAIDEMNRYQDDVRAGRVNTSGSMTVAEWMEHWIETIHRPKVRPTTYDDYARTIRLHIVPHIGSIRLDALKPADVRRMHTAIEASRTAQTAHVILCRALKDAVREELIWRNVAEIAEKPKHVTKHRDPLTADQAKAVMRAAFEANDRWAVRWATAFLLGLRQGEALGLEWSRINLDVGEVDVSWQLQQLKKVHGCQTSRPDTVSQIESMPNCGFSRASSCKQARWDIPRGFEVREVHKGLALTRPKTKAGHRVVPIPAPLHAMLENLQVAQPVRPHNLADRFTDASNAIDLVFLNVDGRPQNPRDDYKRWVEALQRAGVPHAPLHVTRNTTATLLAEAGAPEDIRMAILGHVSISAHRGYVSVSDLQKREAMSKLGNVLELN